MYVSSIIVVAIHTWGTRQCYQSSLLLFGMYVSEKGQGKAILGLTDRAVVIRIKQQWLWLTILQERWPCISSMRRHSYYLFHCLFFCSY